MTGSTRADQRSVASVTSTRSTAAALSTLASVMAATTAPVIAVARAETSGSVSDG